MAVGKGSMERAAKAAEKKTGAEEKKAPAKRAGQSAKKPAVSSSTVIAAPSSEVAEIVYQGSFGILDRAAEPNERFGLGDAMPVYYF